MSSDRFLTLSVSTPDGQSASVTCDRVSCLLKDGADGRGGGWIGILPGHAPMIFSLDRGPVKAGYGEKEVFRAEIGGGFGSVRRDRVTILADSASFPVPDES